jgi:hypothetical protein
LKDFFSTKQVQWGIGIPVAQGDEGGNEAISTTPPSSPLLLGLDAEMLDDEIAALCKESQQYQDSQDHVKRLHSQVPFLVTDQPVDGDESANDDDFLPNEVSDTDSEAAEDDLGAWKAVCIFDNSSLAMIRQCLLDTVTVSKKTVRMFCYYSKILK